ncbi:MAG: hypothetical protein L3K10_07270 [Thermoplasmata archaeon]|nr:hypothetical protein [Thermoplasmata archaeon]
MARSRSGRSTERSASPGRDRPSVDVYLQPAVVGGGLGDIEETLAAGRWLARAGFPIQLYRTGGRALPTSVDGPWEWPPIRRTRRLVPHHRTALTVTPAWGVSAAPPQRGAYGRSGAWAEESREIESAYGIDHVVHLSLEEFARTLSTRDENRERLREGGVPSRRISERLRAADRSGEVETFRSAFRRFRAFDRPNVLHLFATFRRDPVFAREFPAAVQTGPLWPGRYPSAPGGTRPARGAEWVWYASPASAEQIAPSVVAGVRSIHPGGHLLIVTPRPWKVRLPSNQVELRSEPMATTYWATHFARAGVRIVTGSRTLLEAMELGGPFLYFNGVLGRGSSRRRHRPEKIAALLDLAARTGIPADVRRDWSDFARGRRVQEVVERVAERRGGWSGFPHRWTIDSFPPPFDDAGDLIVRVAHALGHPGSSAADLVRRVRAGELPPPRGAPAR